MEKKSKKTGSGFILGVATAAAAFAGYYLFGPKGKENRKVVRGWTLKAKGEILEKIEKLEDISEDTYHNIVDKVMAKYEKLKTTTDEETERLKKELKGRFAHVTRDLKKTKKSAVKKVEDVLEKTKKTNKEKKK